MVGGSLGFLIMVVAMSDLLGVFVWEKRYTQRKREEERKRMRCIDNKINK